MRCPVAPMALLLLLLTVVLFWPATSDYFIRYDDPEYVTENPHIQAGLSWASVKWAFGNTEQAAYWAPMMWLSHMVAFQVFQLRPEGHHLINIVLHAASTVLVFLVFTRMTGAPWRSLLLAALFGWHPLQVESVAWVAERKDVLSAFFGMLSLWGYSRYAASRNIEHRTSNTEHRIKTNGESRTSAFAQKLRRDNGRPRSRPTAKFITGWRWFSSPGTDEQADAGDAAVFDVVAGLLAARKIYDLRFTIYAAPIRYTIWPPSRVAFP